jgi:hypothetical protein
MAREIITLSNGKKVANFSSPHPFTFTDGSVVPAVSNDESLRLKVTFNEEVDESGDVELTFTLSEQVLNEMMYWLKRHTLGLVDVVFCPLPMITAIKDAEANYDGVGDMPDLLWIIEKYGIWDSYKLKHSPFRAVRMEDRIKKLVSIEKQCI